MGEKEVNTTAENEDKYLYIYMINLRNMDINLYFITKDILSPSLPLSLSKFI